MTNRTNKEQSRDYLLRQRNGRRSRKLKEKYAAMTPEIVQKIEAMLSKPDSVRDEKSAVYLMVQLRKIIEAEKLNHPILKFYADWALHTEKSRNFTTETKEIVLRMYDDAVKHINRKWPSIEPSEVERFVSMEKLRASLRSFLSEYAVVTALVDDDHEWTTFIDVLTKVLVNQPMLNPIPEVTRFEFEPAADNCVIAKLWFADPVCKYTHYKFGAVR